MNHPLTNAEIFVVTAALDTVLLTPLAAADKSSIRLLKAQLVHLLEPVGRH